MAGDPDRPTDPPGAFVIGGFLQPGFRLGRQCLICPITVVCTENLNARNGDEVCRGLDAI